MRGRAQREEPLAVLIAQLIVWAWRSVMTSVADVFSRLLTLAPPVGASARAGSRRITRDDAR